MTGGVSCQRLSLRMNGGFHPAGNASRHFRLFACHAAILLRHLYTTQTMSDSDDDYGDDSFEIDAGSKQSSPKKVAAAGNDSEGQTAATATSESCEKCDDSAAKIIEAGINAKTITNFTLSPCSMPSREVLLFLRSIPSHSSTAWVWSEVSRVGQRETRQ